MSNVHSHNTRNSEFNFFVPSVNCHSCSTFYYNAIREWNALPREIKKIKNIQNFKIEVKNFLFSKMKKNFDCEFII